MVAHVEAMRSRLSDLSGCGVHPSWFVRFDPDIERCFGRADFVVQQHRDLFDSLRQRGDALGIHVHAHRWDASQAVTFSDYADQNWTMHSLISRKCRLSAGALTVSGTLRTKCPRNVRAR